MTKTVNRIIAVFLAIAMIIGFSVIGFAEEGSFGLKSGEAVAASGNFKDRYVGDLKITVKSGIEFELADGFSLNVSGTDGQNKTYNASNIKKIEMKGKTAVITVSYEAGMAHETDYTVTFAEGTFKTADGKISKTYSFNTTGNLILESLNSDRPSTTMQRFIRWLSGWEYAYLIKPLIDLLKWFDSL